MYIEPNTNIRIIKNCPLDPTYDHTLYWNDVADQTAYFQGITKYNLTRQTYQRVQKGRMSVGIKAEDLYDCNYLMFQNTSFGDKWFYAFIKGVEYINNVTSEIEFEIDVMQTWFFDYQLGQCFVEREHSVTDKYGENTVPENLETGPYVTTSESNLTVDDLGLYIMVTELVDEVTVYPWSDPGIVGGFPVPCYWISLSKLTSPTLAILKGIIDAYARAGKSDAIVAVFTAPYNMVSTQEGIREQTFNGAQRRITIDPQNNKLFSYPYCCMTASALGQAVELRYELFSGAPSFTVKGGFGANMQVVCLPNNYAGLAQNNEYCISIKDFPICAWVSNYFQNWLAQNKASLAVDTIKGAVGVWSSTSLAGMARNEREGVGASQGVANSLLNVAGLLASVYEQSIIPDKMTGSANAADIMAVSGMSGFYTRCKAIRPEYARIIDNYFTMFGYATHRVKVPNRNSREHWNYVKTVGCVVEGSVPADDITHICNIYNNGITFWHNPEEIGDYTLDNRPSVG